MLGGISWIDYVLVGTLAAIGLGAVGVHLVAKRKHVKCAFCKAPMLRSELRCHHCQGSVSTFVRAKNEGAPVQRVKLPPRRRTGS